VIITIYGHVCYNSIEGRPLLIRLMLVSVLFLQPRQVVCKTLAPLSTLFQVPLQGLL